MKEYKHPANLLNLKPPKINPEIESSQQYQSNTSFTRVKIMWSKLFRYVKYDKLNFQSFRCW